MSVMSTLRRNISQHITGYRLNGGQWKKQGTDILEATIGNANPMKHKAFAKVVNREVSIEKEQEEFLTKMELAVTEGRAIKTETGFQFIGLERFRQ